ncbi:hypothetical protein HYPSUDRAFT_199647 [Hypholoma sublateritium FD-334 SS-4]|uniref:Uncharacterized protein n=1 Tax=Hypholoma sublateritium (strain FD-334 SS-4) TaxID=945553 RepID=A0A0D2PA38_HYPSF|nr:hypothetical protein HYPSUDRAFT_199647 [Hypholoma sublateritium FD-334 SS-4]
MPPTGLVPNSSTPGQHSRSPAADELDYKLTARQQQRAQSRHPAIHIVTRRALLLAVAYLPRTAAPQRPPSHPETPKRRCAVDDIDTRDARSPLAALPLSTCRARCFLAVPDPICPQSRHRAALPSTMSAPVQQRLLGCAVMTRQPGRFRSAAGAYRSAPTLRDFSPSNEPLCGLTHARVKAPLTAANVFALVISAEQDMRVDMHPRHSRAPGGLNHKGARFTHRTDSMRACTCIPCIPARSRPPSTAPHL